MHMTVTYGNVAVKKHCHRLKKEQHYIFYANASFSWKQMRNAFAKIKYLYASGVSEWMVERVKQSPFLQIESVV